MMDDKFKAMIWSSSVKLEPTESYPLAGRMAAAIT